MERARQMKRTEACERGAAAYCLLHTATAVKGWLVSLRGVSASQDREVLANCASADVEWSGMAHDLRPFTPNGAGLTCSSELTGTQ